MIFDPSSTPSKARFGDAGTLAIENDHYIVKFLGRVVRGKATSDCVGAPVIVLHDTSVIARPVSFAGSFQIALAS